MAKDMKTIIALTNALATASMATSSAASKKAKLEDARSNVDDQKTDIWDYAIPSENIAGEKYDEEDEQERNDLKTLEKLLSSKKEEILALLDSKIAEADEALSSAQAAEKSARNALNAAIAAT